jgi:hypothetical protein
MFVGSAMSLPTGNLAEQTTFAVRLLKAAEQGDHNTLLSLLEMVPPMSVDVVNHSHFTPLILAAYSGGILYKFLSVPSSHFFSI